MTTTGEFQYVTGRGTGTGWFTVFVNKTGCIERVGPFETQEEARLEREKQTGAKP
jgi:hypothetical protein